MIAKALTPLGDQKTKLCPKCGKKKLLKFYYKDTRRLDGCSSYCKICHGKIESARHQKKIKGKTFPKHLWDGDVCKRCKLKRKEFPHVYKVGKYYVQYLVKGEWGYDRPKCKVK